MCAPARGNNRANHEACVVSSGLCSSVHAAGSKQNNSVESAVFVIINNERICLASSKAAIQLGHFISTTGLSTYILTDKHKLHKELRKYEPQRLWKLKYKTSYPKEGTQKEKKEYDLKCPEEMEICGDEKDKDHFFIKPVNPVSPEIFRQVSTL